MYSSPKRYFFMAGESIVQREKMCYLNVYGGGAYGIWKKYYQPNIILKKKIKSKLF